MIESQSGRGFVELRAEVRPRMTHIVKPVAHFQAKKPGRFPRQGQNLESQGLVPLQSHFSGTYLTHFSPLAAVAMEVYLDFRLRQLQCFVVLADTLNYGKAARLLYMSQPTLTFQIKSLEEAFGTKLFNRDRQHVSLTDAGFAFRDYATNILATARAAKDHLNHLACRLALRVSCGPVGQFVVLPQVIQSLARIYPEFQLEILELTTEEQIFRLREAKVDALLMVPEPPIEGMRFEQICCESLVAMVSQESPLAQKRMISVRDLKSTGIIVSRRRDCRFHQAFLQDLFAKFDIVPRFVEAPQSCSVQLAYVAAGEGILLVPRSVTACSFPGVISLPIQEKLPRIKLGIASMPTNSSIAMKIFRQIALQCASGLGAARDGGLEDQPAAAPLSVIPMRREAS